jgi:hypothetical protein
MRKPILIASSLLLLLFAAPAGAEEFTRSFPVAGPGRLVLDLDRGSVDVLTHREATVQVRALAHGLGASSVRFEATRSGNDVVLRARPDEWVDFLNSGPRIQIEVWVPASFEVVCSSERALVTRRDAVELSWPTRAIGKLTR